MPLPLALQPLRLLLSDFSGQRRELCRERPPGEQIGLVECTLTALVRPLEHEAERSKSGSTAIAFGCTSRARRAAGPSFAVDFPREHEWTNCCGCASFCARRTSVNSTITRRAPPIPKVRSTAAS